MADETPEDPRVTYKALRDATPVLHNELGPRPGVVVSRYEDVVSLLRTPEVFSSNDDAVAIGQKRPLIPLQLDPPEQTKYRKLMAPLFAPKVIDAMEAQTRALADTRLRVEGPVAREWMSIAQCFAGPPEDPPAPGSRCLEPATDARGGGS